jgi:hypothetical protein
MGSRSTEHHARTPHRFHLQTRHCCNVEILGLPKITWYSKSSHLIITHDQDTPTVPVTMP